MLHRLLDIAFEQIRMAKRRCCHEGRHVPQEERWRQCPDKRMVYAGLFLACDGLILFARTFTANREASMRKTSSKLASTIAYGALGPYVESPADDYVATMGEASGPQRLASVKLALEADPDNIEALVAKAEYITSDKECRLEVLKRAVKVGSRLWTPVEKEYGRKMSWWDFPGTRPYMRAIYALGQACEEAGDLATARHCYESLVRMNERDPMGARFAIERMPVAQGVSPRA
ncbi:DUF4397 domain-containing protein [Azospirillum sp. TSH64]|uniref:DUF4397 domain-containing protein n=1 Tax=Azospirillum sp. TSH64 TaxID=652740 RepID=UPI0011B29235|nr:DUF4397 domain-containing protein [Azospirillum sp. TSH64]